MQARKFALNFNQSLQLIDFLKQNPFEFEFNHGEIVAENCHILLPFCFKTQHQLPENFSSLNFKNAAIFLLVQSGAAALGFSINGELLQHKVIKKYMVRKKQGKAQLKHLNAKGKSRLGSRIRLQQADKFFNEIHQKIESWDVLNQTNVIYYSYAKSLIPFIYNTPDQPILKKNDDRLVKIPFDISEPGINTLNYVNKLVHKSIVTIGNPEIWEKIVKQFPDFTNEKGAEKPL